MNPTDPTNPGSRPSPNPSSSPSPGSGPSNLRPSNAEREPYTAALAESYAEGRLSPELYEQRMAAATRAESFDELDGLVADLPYDTEWLRPDYAGQVVHASNGRMARGRRLGARKGGRSGDDRPGMQKTGEAGDRRTTLRRLVPVAGALVALVFGFCAGAGIGHARSVPAAPAAPVFNAGPDYSTTAGKSVKAPGTLPELGTAFTQVTPLAADTIAQVADFVDREQLGFITRISASGDLTQLYVVDSDQRFKLFNLRADRAPTGEASTAEFAPIANMDAAVKLNLRTVLKTARKDLDSDAELSDITVGTKLMDYQTNRYIDVVTVSFSGTNEQGKRSITYRLKGMKEMERG